MKIQSMNHAFTGWFMLLQAEPRWATLIFTPTMLKWAGIRLNFANQGLLSYMVHHRFVMLLAGAIHYQ